MTKTLAELKALCNQLGIIVPPPKRAAKDPYLQALRDHFWEMEHPDCPLPEQIEPMLLGDWNDLDDTEATAIEQDESGWCVQEKRDGVRCLLHIMPDGIRLTGRVVSEVNFRLSEFQSNVPHLTTGFEKLIGTVLDGELICPTSAIDTGDTRTTHPLQAAVAILATSSERARAIQEQQGCPLRFVAFDILRFNGVDVTIEPLKNRLTALDSVYLAAENSHLGLVETRTANKALFHDLLMLDGKEGSVWKRLEQPYEPGRRVRHWLKRKKAIEIEAVATGFKLGTKGKGNEHAVGAIEFSTVDADGATKPIAWVSNLTSEERERMTRRDGDIVTLDQAMLGRRALVAGHDIAGKSGRFRHARIIKWLDAA